MKKILVVMTGLALSFSLHAAKKSNCMDLSNTSTTISGVQYLVSGNVCMFSGTSTESFESFIVDHADGKAYSFQGLNYTTSKGKTALVSGAITVQKVTVVKPVVVTSAGPQDTLGEFLTDIFRQLTTGSGTQGNWKGKADVENK